jgi:hypothetical protein
MPSPCPLRQRTVNATSKPCRRPTHPVIALSTEPSPCQHAVDIVNALSYPCPDLDMNVYEYLSRATPQKGSKLAPYSDEIRVLLQHGRTYQAIVVFLMEAHNLAVTRQSLREFCLRHFRQETADLTSIVRKTARPLPVQPPIAITVAPIQEAPSSSHVIDETSAFTRSSTKPVSPPCAPHWQTRIHAHVESSPDESERPALKAASKLPVFQPTPPEPSPNIEKSQSRVRDAAKLMAFLSAPAMPRRTETELRELNERSEELKAADRKRRREEPR